MTVVGILGTIHSEEQRQETGYTLEIMKNIIEEFKPDIICGEVRPEDWEEYSKDKGYSGYLGPNEYRSLIIPLCQSKGIEFKPVDWFEDDLVYLIDIIYNNEKIKNHDINLYKKLGELEAKYDNQVSKQEKIPLNSLGYNDLIEQTESIYGRISPNEHNILWVARNQIMIERIKKVISQNEGKRILCTVGACHNYFYYNELSKGNYEVVYPLK